MLLSLRVSESPTKYGGTRPYKILGSAKDFNPSSTPRVERWEQTTITF